MIGGPNVSKLRCSIVGVGLVLGVALLAAGVLAARRYFDAPLRAIKRPPHLVEEYRFGGDDEEEIPS